LLLLNSAVLRCLQALIQTYSAEKSAAAAIRIGFTYGTPRDSSTPHIGEQWCQVLIMCFSGSVRGK
jgi:hypothetical protein